MRMKMYALWLLLFAVLSLPLCVYADGSLTVQVRYADAVPFTDTAGYTVNAYVSVLDSAGVPVKGLTRNGFRIYEEQAAFSKSSARMTGLR